VQALVIELLPETEAARRQVSLFQRAVSVVSPGEPTVHHLDHRSAGVGTSRHDLAHSAMCLSSLKCSQAAAQSSQLLAQLSQAYAARWLCRADSVAANRQKLGAVHTKAHAFGVFLVAGGDLVQAVVVTRSHCKAQSPHALAQVMKWA